MNVESKNNIMGKNQVKELSYYLFFGLMILAKGIGLDSGDKFYYILSGLAGICVLVKLVLTKYTKSQLIAVVLLGVIAGVSYMNSGRLGIILSVLAIVGSKDIDIKKLLRFGAVIYGISFCITFIFAALHIIPNPFVVHEKSGVGEIIRWGMGYATANILHASYFIFTVFLCYSWGKKYNFKRFFILMAANIFVFLFSVSYTGVSVTTFYLILALYAAKKTELKKWEKIVCQLPLPLCLFFSFVMPFLLKNPIVQKIDAILQARLTFSGYYLSNQPITLLGTRMKDVPNFWIIMDNSYVYIFMTFGILVFALFAAGYAVMIGRFSGLRPVFHKKASDEKVDMENDVRLPELAMIFAFLLYGITEQFLSNAFMNVSLLFMGEVLFGMGKASMPATGIETLLEESKLFQKLSVCRTKCVFFLSQKNKMILGVAGIVSVCSLTGYFLLNKQPAYVAVPYHTLSYVDAQSVLIHIDNPEGTKDYLKIQLKDYKDGLLDSELIEKCLESSGKDSGVTTEMIKDAIEVSIPVSLQKSRQYDAFRVRLLKLYSGVEDRVYENILKAITEEMKGQPKTSKFIVDELYAEKIGKSFGEDRIEHMSADRTYMVEKTGNLVSVEYMRGGLICVVVVFVSVILVLDVIIIVFGFIKRDGDKGDDGKYKNVYGGEK